MRLTAVQEGNSGLIELKAAVDDDDAVAEDNPQAVQLMIDYLYLRDYDPKSVNEISTIKTTNARGDLSDDGAALEHQSEGSRSLTTERIDGKSVDEVVTISELPGDGQSQAEVPKLAGNKKKTKKDKKKKAMVNARYPSPTLSARGSPTATASSSTSFLAVHAKMYAIAAKYSIPLLMQAALNKFKAESEGAWECQDLTEAIPIVFNQTAEMETQMREALTTLILENAHNLTSDANFIIALERVDGLALDLFQRLSGLSRYQKICRWCERAFLSKCASDGCEPNSFGMYGSSHSCDLEGPCRDCRSRKSWA